SARRRRAPPLKRPRGTASATTPCASAPAGITTLPFNSTGLTREAAKVSPGRLIFDPTACPSCTVSTVPAGTTMGLASSLGCIADCGEGGADVAAEEPSDEVAGWGLLHPAMTARHRSRTSVC